MACALLAAGCGGEERAATPTLPPALADGLAARSEAVATKLDAGDACGAREEAEALQADTIAAVNDGRIPPLYHEELVGSVNALVDSIECAAPPPAPAQTEPPADEVDDPEEDEEDDAEDEPGNGKEKGKSKGKKKGKKK